MSLIEEIVGINISKATTSTRSINTNTLLILGNSNKAKNGQPRVKAYGSLTEVASDFATTSHEYKAATLYFAQEPRPVKLLIGQVIGNTESFADAYSAVTLANDDFYGVMVTTRDAPSVTGLAKIVESENRIFGVSSHDIENSAVFDAVKGLKRTFSIFHTKALANGDFYPEAAWFGKMLTKKAGSATWCYKVLSGITSDIVSTDERAKLSTQYINFCAGIAGRDVMLEGKLMSGESIDTIVGLDWVTFELRTNIIDALIASEKLPFTNSGIAVIESMIRNTLQLAVQRDIVDAHTIKVSVPDVRDISERDKLARILPDIKFEARLVGAIHRLSINGTVTV